MKLFLKLLSGVVLSEDVPVHQRFQAGTVQPLSPQTRQQPQGLRPAHFRRHVATPHQYRTGVRRAGQHVPPPAAPGGEGAVFPLPAGADPLQQGDARARSEGVGAEQGAGERGRGDDFQPAPQEVQGKYTEKIFLI